MSKIKSFNLEGAANGDIDFADELLTLDKGDQAVKDVVVATLAARRAGSASTLGKGEVSGTNRKPWKQKGTGRARSGFTRSPVWVGGGIAMGPKPHGYDKKVNKKVAALAFRRAISAQIAEGKVSVIESLPTDGKTKTIASLVKTMGLEGRTLVITEKYDEKIELAIRNIPNVEVLSAKQVDVYSILQARNILMTKEALEAIKARMNKEVAA